MGKFFDKFSKIGRQANRIANKVVEKIGDIQEDNSKTKKKKYVWDEISDYNDPFLNPEKGKDIISDPFSINEFPVRQSQKPESFHRYILEEQDQDIERLIRGLEDIWDEKERKIRTVKKKVHCFTDEEAERIIRFVQSQLSTGIKLSLIPKNNFGDYLIGIFDQIQFLFRSISEYRYGRYGSYENQRKMKEENLEILIAVWTRIQANYSRAIEGRENRFTHDSIRGQEALNQTGINNFGGGWNF